MPKLSANFFFIYSEVIQELTNDKPTTSIRINDSNILSLIKDSTNKIKVNADLYKNDDKYLTESECDTKYVVKNNNSTINGVFTITSANSTVPLKVYSTKGDNRCNINLGISASEHAYIRYAKTVNVGQSLPLVIGANEHSLAVFMR